MTVAKMTGARVSHGCTGQRTDNTSPYRIKRENTSRQNAPSKENIPSHRTMARSRIVIGDTVVVTALGSKYRGKVGEVRSFTDSKQSARLVLRDGSKATVRISSLDVAASMSPKRYVAVSQAVSSASKSTQRDIEVQQLRKELKAMRKVVYQLLMRFGADSNDPTAATPHTNC